MNPELAKYLRNVAYAASASQGGCLTVVVVFAALFAGLWLDAQLHTKPLFTLLLVLISIPISLFLMLQFTLRAVRNLSYNKRTEQADRPTSEKEHRP